MLPSSEIPGADSEAVEAPAAGHRHGVLLTLAYDGSTFSGFALQGAQRTVARILSDAIAKMDVSAGRLRVASRTDQGVHARGQVVCFDTALQIESRGWLLGLNAYLPPEVAIVRVARVAVGFNPARQAQRKTYRYLILRGSIRDPFLAGRAWRVHDSLDLEQMQREAQALLGTHDFRAFRGSADCRDNTLRSIESAGFREPREAPRCLEFEIRGDRFMYHMVRIIVGTLVDVGRKRREPGAVERALRSLQRDDLGMTAPPDGLCLERVELEDWGSAEWPNHSG